jgi:nitroimidazol reductase NimA-like FMN-containing flavoprotein (pyridoxamine 5'-phosphate oxidase superfamily)
MQCGEHRAKEKSMIDKMKALVKHKDTCVLATASQNKPHCSLMAFATNDECSEIYMVTSRDSKKYRNLMQNPTVSLLVDTRDEAQDSDLLKAKALTIEGEFRQIEDTGKKDFVRDRLRAKHPHLEALISDPNSEVFSIRVVSFLLLEGPTDAHFEQIS